MASVILSEICPFVFINLLGPPSISNIFFTFGVWARLASIKCRFVPLSKESIRLFLSRLPVRGSNLRHPAAGARSNSTSYQAGNLVSKLGVKADRLPENQRKKEVPFFSPAPWLLAPPFRLARGDFADFDGTVAIETGAGCLFRCFSPARVSLSSLWRGVLSLPAL